MVGTCRPTLVGRNVPITSEVFCVGSGPPGGGGGTTRGPAIVAAYSTITFDLVVAQAPCTGILPLYVC